MLSISELKNNENNKELYLLKLESELNRVKEAHKLNELLWVEKEDSLNSVISEQKKVISLLESLLKNSQHLLDTVQTSITQKNKQVDIINAEVGEAFEKTHTQVELLKKTANKAEELLKLKESELAFYQQEVGELNARSEAVAQKLETAIRENELQSRTIDDARKAAEHLRGEMEQCQRRCDELQELYNTLSEAYSSLESEYQVVLGKQSALLATTDRYQLEVNNLLAENDRLRASVQNEKRVNSERYNAITLLTSEHHSVTKALGEASNESSLLLARLTEEQKKVADSLDAKQKLQDKLSNIQTKMEGLTAREVKYKKTLGELEDKVLFVQDKIRATISYQLGHAIIQAGKSFHGFFQLPGTLFRIRKDAKNRRLSKQIKLTGNVVQPAKGLANRVLHEPMPLESVELGPVHEQTEKRKLKIAGVMDEFTYHSYAPEADILQLIPENWEQQLNDFKPDLLFIESAWQGIDGLWKTKISNAKEEIQGAIKWCNLNNVPTLFWNKEDPVHFGTFLPIASLVDFVFTTDIDCIPKYKQRVGHDNVFLLPFAAQPKTHNPIEKFERKDAFNFAGSYYLRYPERQRDFSSLMDTVQQFRAVEVYDRNFDNPHPHYTFPEKYKRFILGKLPFSEIDKAYKGYRYGINMNTIKQSQTMFARRVFELLASNTVVVSNFSRGVRLLFGDLVVSSDNASQLKGRLDLICQDEINYRKFRLLGLRKVFSEHTYSHRLAYIRAKLSKKEYKINRSSIYVIAKVNNKEEYERVKTNFSRQNYDQKTLYVLCSNDELNASISADNVGYFNVESEFIKTIDQLPGHVFFAVFSVNDYYGPNYLNDLELATLYSESLVVGKSAHYVLLEDAVRLVNDGNQYSLGSELAARRSIIRRSGLTNEIAKKIFSSPDQVIFDINGMLVTDEFNYCCSVNDIYLNNVIAQVDDLHVMDEGVSYTNRLIDISEKLSPSEIDSDKVSQNDVGPGLSGIELAELISKPASSAIQFSKHGTSFKITSKLPEGKHVYAYTKRNFKREELNLVLNSQFKLECKGSLEAMTVFEFQDKDGKKIAHSINKLGDAHALAIPEHCVYVRFGLKLQASGQLIIERLSIGTKNERPFAIIGKSNTLVISKQYPDYNDLYKYGFVHSRVRAYRQSALLTEIFRVFNNPGNHYREFEGIDIASGDYSLLHSTLRTGQFSNILVHILDDKTWDVVKHYLPSAKVIVWVHGSEIQHWKRRAFEFKNMTDAEIGRQKKLSDKRMKFWKDIFASQHPNLHFVFVSQWLVDSTEEDLGVSIPKESYSIINNFVDGKIFNYSEKKSEDRLKLLSIRPYAKLVYANDLTVAAIVELSKRPFFNELQFTLIGDGELFDDTVKPVAEFPNVTIKKMFLTHSEISAFHKENGIFMVPSRMDTQGVSRDEAMSSGLVPITTRVAAIPEFVNDKVAMIVNPEDYIGIADAVEALYRDEQRFLKLSRQASESVANKCGFQQTLQQELNLVTKMDGANVVL